MTGRKRRHFSPQDKILRLHLLEARPISDLREDHGFHPIFFYQWQNIFFESGASAFESKRGGFTGDQELIARLKVTLRHKDEVLFLTRFQNPARIGIDIPESFGAYFALRHGRNHQKYQPEA